jgi:hypothetical protein
MELKFGPRSAALLLALVLSAVVASVFAFWGRNHSDVSHTAKASSAAENARGSASKSAATTGARILPTACVDCAVHVVTKGQGLGSIARHYVDETSFLTLAELESAIRQVNGIGRKSYFKLGEKLLIPGMLKEPIVEHPIPVAKDFEVRGIYLTGYTAGSEHGMELIRRWRAAGGNAIAFDVKDMDGVVNVPFHDPLASEQPNVAIRSLPKFNHFLHSLGLRSIARIALFRDAHLAQRHPQLDPRSRKSGGPWRENGKQVWVDPSLPEVQDYNLALARMVADSGVDEVQFDYVRFPAEGDQKDAVFAFESRHPGWNRSDVIANFLERAYAELHPRGVLVSLDVFGVMAWQRPVDLSHTGQNIPRMVRHCDVLSPMIYPSHFFGMDGYKVPGDAPQHFIGESMDRFREATASSGVVLRPWLQGFAWRTPSYSPAYVVKQVAEARETGGIGFLFWNAGNDYSKVFSAMAIMTAAAGQYFRGDQVPAERDMQHDSPALTKGRPPIQGRARASR